MGRVRKVFQRTMNRYRQYRLFLCFLVLTLFFDDTVAFCLHNHVSSKVRVGKGFEYRNEMSGSMRRMTKDEIWESEIGALEKEVVASTKAKLDLKRVTQALDANTSSNEDPEKTAILAEPWKIATAAAIAASSFAFVTTSSYFVSLLALIGVFLVASGDPVDEQGAFGAFARLLGRVTIKSVESSRPKLRAMARAAITNEEEILNLKQKVEHLQEENARLALWKQRRMAVDESSNYSVDELKGKARKRNLQFLWEGTTFY
jgi:hypothetical protein